jgi:hypothetical protein
MNMDQRAVDNRSRAATTPDFLWSLPAVARFQVNIAPSVPMTCCSATMICEPGHSVSSHLKHMVRDQGSEVQILSPRPFSKFRPISLKS